MVIVVQSTSILIAQSTKSLLKLFAPDLTEFEVTRFHQDVEKNHMFAKIFICKQRCLSMAPSGQ